MCVWQLDILLMNAHLLSAGLHAITAMTLIKAHTGCTREGWKLVFSDMHVCLGQNSLSRCCQVSSRSTAIALPYMQSI